MKLKDLFNGMIVTLGDAVDATHYRVHEIRETIVTLSYVNASGRVVYTEPVHYSLLKPVRVK